MTDHDRQEAVEARWQRLRDELGSIQEELEDDGWKTVRFEAGDVSTVTDSEAAFGIHVVVPDNRFEKLQQFVQDGVVFDTFEIYKRETETFVYAIVVAKDEAAEVALLYPVYYSTAERPQLQREAESQGTMRTHLKTLGDDRVVLEQDPDAFFSG